MSLVERMKAAEQGELFEPENKFNGVADTLIGLRPKVKVPVAAQFEEPGDFEPEPQGRFPNEALKQGRDFLQENGFYPSEFQKNSPVEVINDSYLMSLAKMQVASMNLKTTMMTEPVRLALQMAYKYIDRPDKAEEIKQISVKDDIEEFQELILEVVFQELKALQRANNLRVPPATELMSHYRNVLFQKWAGDGFENLTGLAEGIYKKITKKA